MNWKASVRVQSWPNIALAYHPNIYRRDYENQEYRVEVLATSLCELVVSVFVFLFSLILRFYELYHKRPTITVSCMRYLGTGA
jgi:hypothetical protein